VTGSFGVSGTERTVKLLTEAEVSRGGVMLDVRRSLIFEPADFATPSSTNFFT